MGVFLGGGQSGMRELNASIECEKGKCQMVKTM